MNFDWVWSFGGKKKWDKLIVANIDGAFINKKQIDPDHERIMYFSKDLGLLSCLSRMHYKTDKYIIQESEQRHYIYNESSSVFNNVDKEDYDYIKFTSTKKAIIILETNVNDDYIIGVLLDQDRILKELLEC